MRQKIEILLDKVKQLEKSSKLAASESKQAANEASGGLTASYSAAGDAEHARNSANLSIQKYQAVKNLELELSESVNLEIPQSVSPVCFIKIETQGSIKELYLTKTPVYIGGFSLISPGSPIGEALSGKKIGDLFLYKNGSESFTGKILEIG